MEIIRSRQNPLVKRLHALGADSRVRETSGEYLCAGEKLLREALASGAEITCTLASAEVDAPGLRLALPEIVQAVSPLKNSPGPVFSVRRKQSAAPEKISRAIVLENVQDPGNVGTVLRTADAFGIDLVVLCGACADAYGPKSVRASMVAIFRQTVIRSEVSELTDLLKGLRLYGAALDPQAMDVRELPKSGVAVAVGNEGQGLSDAFLEQCAASVMIPMDPRSESLNAGVAASVIIFLFMIPYTASLYNGLSRLFRMAFNVDYAVCVIIMAVLTAVYVIMGGYMATAVNDFIQGAGLGLSICKAFADACHGDIGVISDGMGKGSLFWMWVPV